MRDQRSHQIQANNGGFSLIEVVVGMVIIIMILFSAFLFVTRSYQFSQMDRAQEQAVRLARETVESIKAKLENKACKDSVAATNPANCNISFNASSSYTGQTLPLKNIMNNTTLTETLYYPSSQNPKFTIKIKTLPIDNSKVVQIADIGKSLKLNDYFRHFSIEVKGPLNVSFIAEQYIAYK